MNWAFRTRRRPTVIELEHVTRAYGEGHAAVRALDDATMSVAPGEFVVVLGPSGSGKTTPLNVIGALGVPGRHVEDLGNSSRGTNGRRAVEENKRGVVAPRTPDSSNDALTSAMALAAEANHRA